MQVFDCTPFIRRDIPPRDYQQNRSVTLSGIDGRWYPLEVTPVVRYDLVE